MANVNENTLISAAQKKQNQATLKAVTKPAANALDVFNGVTGFAGFYKAFDGNLGAIAFQRAGKPSSIDSGFLVSGLSVNWNRSIQLQRILNNTKPVAMIGVGSGSLSCNGLIGTYDGFSSLLEDDSKENICHPMSAVIAAGTGFVGCDANGKQQNLSGVGISLSNVLCTGIAFRHEIRGDGIMLQVADVTFQIGGVSIFAV